MLEECGLPHDLRVVGIERGEPFEPSFLAIPPNTPKRGRSTVRRDGETPREPRISGGPVFDRRHGVRRLDQGLEAHGAPRAAKADLSTDEEARKILFGQKARQRRGSARVLQ